MITTFAALENIKTKEMLGLYISGHPLDMIRERLEQLKTPIQAFTDEHNHKIVSVTGTIGM